MIDKPAFNMISCGECIHTVHSQPSYCLTIQWHPLWFWMKDKLYQPASWYDVVNASTQYTVNPPTVWPFNDILFGFEWKISYASLHHDVVNASTRYTVNPPTVWPFNIIRYDLKWQMNCASLQQYDMWLKCLHCTQSALLLSGHSVSASVVVNDTFTVSLQW